MEQTADCFSAVSLGDENEDEVEEIVRDTAVSKAAAAITPAPHSEDPMRTLSSDTQTSTPQTTIMVPTGERNNKSTSFLDIPGELRNEIYTLAMPSGCKVDMKVKNLPWKLLGINVAGVRDQIGIEASTIFFRSNTFRANTYDEASRFLRSIDVERRGMIRRLELEYLANNEELAGVNAKRAPNSCITAQAVNQLLGAWHIRGLRPNAVFVPGNSETDWVCLTEVPDMEIAEFTEGWEARWKVPERTETTAVRLHGTPYQMRAMAYQMRTSSV